MRSGDEGDHLDGTHRHSERFARRGVGQVLRAPEAMGEDLLPVIRPHDRSAALLEG
ncbi:hypothetical protein SAMN05660350_03864 [Geodermatophilus obscurus]|uniref:Uncharacterized protein n=1 Tax=Geodermatophilus obscurus TaxID=1861 RepID=A0A1M7USQ1_9ACTN|nr:hypothetical protein [Geodermatophilus obscurus]SHN86031.1 hypothetical protein SAMN05660350_03864 [Geodermatophilus obscurus]